MGGVVLEVESEGACLMHLPHCACRSSGAHIMLTGLSPLSLARQQRRQVSECSGDADHGLERKFARWRAGGSGSCCGGCRARRWQAELGAAGRGQIVDGHLAAAFQEAADLEGAGSHARSGWHAALACRLSLTRAARNHSPCTCAHQACVFVLPVCRRVVVCGCVYRMPSCP